MTGDRSKFKVLDESIAGQVHFGDGSSVSIKGKGSIVFKCKNGEEMLLKEVYFIPTLCNNIISLGQMSEEGNKVILKGEFLWVYDVTGKLVMKVRRSQNRLYKLIIEDTGGVCLLSKTEELTWLWHTRLGHVNFKAMSIMSENDMVYGLPKLVQPNDVCKGCLVSKQTRKPFPAKSTFTANKILELIHGDLCGPINPPTPGGCRYFLLLVDDFSRVMWVYMLKTKDEALDSFKKFKALVENGREEKVKVLRTDRGGEFCSAKFGEFCDEAGIMRHFTAPYSPQQNGVVERRNRTVVEMTRSLLKERNMPSKFWGEAVRHAVYLLNRLPTRALSGTTPYEAWSSKKPNIDHIKVFGCISHMKIPAVNVKKLDDRSKMVVNLGQEPGTKAYRLYDPNSGAIHVSRDVVFEESKSWPWTDTEIDESVAAPSFTVVNISTEATENDEFQMESQSSPYQMSPNTHATSQMSQSSQSSEQSNGGTESSQSTEPRNFRLLSDIYNETEEIELEDDLLLLSVEEPSNYYKAAKKKEWEIAMKHEIDSIEKNQTWKLTELPAGKRAIGLKWVFKLKKNTDGEIIKHKACLVAKGYVQKQGIDYEEAFALVTRLETVHLILALAAKNGWEVHHLDVKSAFLNGVLQEEVYVLQPEGFEKTGEEHKVYKLIKALYGLCQALRAWYARLNRCLEELGFVKCPHEHAVYTRREGDESLIVGVYVDDLIITGTRLSNIVKFKKQMAEEFDMSDLGKLSYYLGIEVEQGKEYIELKQAAYAKKILEKAGMSECKPVKFPMEYKTQLHKDEKGKAVNSTDFKSMLGSLRYLVHTRPDIAYSVGVVSRYMERPTVLHLNAVKRIMRYVRGTLDFGLVYLRGKGNYLLEGFLDSDLAGNLDDRKSTGGLAFYLNESLVAWVSQKQKCVALSSCEAEFMAANAAACQGIWLHKVLNQISDESIGPVVLYIDNKSAIDLTKNPVFHGRSKHIDIRYHFIRECVERGDVIVKHVRTEEQKADVSTKAMSKVKFERMRKLLGVKNLIKNSFD